MHFVVVRNKKRRLAPTHKGAMTLRRLIVGNRLGLYDVILFVPKEISPLLPTSADLCNDAVDRGVP